jgi:hypothetical protein
MTNLTVIYFDIAFNSPQGKSRMWATKLEAVHGDDEKQQFGGVIATEYQTGNTLKINACDLISVSHGFMVIELA